MWQALMRNKCLEAETLLRVIRLLKDFLKTIIEVLKGTNIIENWDAEKIARLT